MRIAMAQIDARAGDLVGNEERIVAAVHEAASQRADLVVFPEMVLPGIVPRDLLTEPRFVDATLEATERLARRLDGAPSVLLGTIAPAPRQRPRDPNLYDVAAHLESGRVRARIAKQLLPAGDVFHEARWFVPGREPGWIDVGGRRVGVLLCEDLWSEGYARDPAAALRDAGCEAIVCLSSSPYRKGVDAQRMHHARRVARPFVYVNTVGSHDELVFDGGSFALANDVVHRAPRFTEGVFVVDLGALEPSNVESVSLEEELFRALVAGVRGFFAKNGLPRAFVGLSGGIDSALVACIASEALGPGRVVGVALPSRYNDPRSLEDARSLACALGIGFASVEIESLRRTTEDVLAPHLGPPANDATLENVQARLRMLVLMALVNRRGGTLLNTSNKSEAALGYGTLYGDMAGSLSVIGDLWKTEVFRVAHWYARTHGAIPAFTLDRAPSAELREGQVDPFDYARVDPALEALLHGATRPDGFDRNEWDRLAFAFHRAEAKRWQGGIVLKVSERAFGTGRLVPVTRAV